MIIAATATAILILALIGRQACIDHDRTKISRENLKDWRKIAKRSK